MVNLRLEYIALGVEAELRNCERFLALAINQPAKDNLVLQVREDGLCCLSVARALGRGSRQCLTDIGGERPELSGSL